MKIQSVTHNNRKSAFQAEGIEEAVPASLLKGRSSTDQLDDHGCQAVC